MVGRKNLISQYVSCLCSHLPSFPLLYGPPQSLNGFQYVEPSGKDQGINVRKKAQTLVALLRDTDKIREAREKAKANKNK